MHGHLATVIRAISGVTGLAMLRALLAGERDPARRAAFTDDRLNASPHTSANSLAGHWRDEVRCHRRQALERYAGDPQKSAEGDPPIEAPRLTFDRKLEGSAPPLPTPQRRPQKARRHAPHVALHPPRSRISGVDVTRLDGLEGLTAQPLMAEIGREMSRGKRATHVASWLG